MLGFQSVGTEMEQSKNKGRYEPVIKVSFLCENELQKECVDLSSIKPISSEKGLPNKCFAEHPGISCKIPPCQSARQLTELEPNHVDKSRDQIQLWPDRLM